MKDYDLVLRNASILDGSGKPRYDGDIAVTGERIAALGDLGPARGRDEIDLHGLAVAPGFIDVHTHDDRALLSSPAMLPKLTQGVTTVVTGNCGISLAPLSKAHAVPPLDLVAEAGGARYARFADYIAALRTAGIAVNALPLVGHTTLRAEVMQDLQRPANEAEIAAMREHVDVAMRAGAWGLSTGTFYPPAREAPTAEIVAVGEPLKRYGGVFATHMRNEAEKVMDSLDETFLIGRELGVRVIISHHKLAGLCNHGRSVQTLARIAQAMESQPVGLDCYPYNASSTMLHPDLIDRASSVLVAWSTPHPEFAGQELAAVAEQMGCDAKTAAIRLAPAGAIYFIMDEADVRRILAFPPTMIGSDGLPHDAHPHPRLWGAFPRVLGHYCRETSLFALEQAVHKMSGLPAGQFGLQQRGLLAPDHYADLVVFDPDTVIDSASFAQPATPAAGIRRVYVNGQLALDEQGARPVRAGRVLDGPAARG